MSNEPHVNHTPSPVTSPLDACVDTLTVKRGLLGEGTGCDVLVSLCTLYFISYPDHLTCSDDEFVIAYNFASSAHCFTTFVRKAVSSHAKCISFLVHCDKASF